MASENETVADIVKCIRQVAHNAATANKETKERWRPAAFLATVADRIESAHGREVAELKRRLKVAEDALKLCIRGMCGECSRQHPGETCVNGCYEMTAAKNALAAIREEGGAK